MLIDIKTENFYEGNKLVTVEYCLYINDKREGYIGIDVTHHQNYVTVSQVNSRYRNRGFGKMLYPSSSAKAFLSPCIHLSHSSKPPVSLFLCKFSILFT